MKKKDLTYPDNLFNEGLSGHEVEFNPDHWEHMKSLLDEEDDLIPVVILDSSNNNNKSKLSTLILIIMSILSILTTIGTLLYSSAGSGFNHTQLNAANPVTSEIKSENSSKKSLKLAPSDFNSEKNIESNRVITSSSSHTNSSQLPQNKKVNVSKTTQNQVVKNIETIGIPLGKIDSPMMKDGRIISSFDSSENLIIGDKNYRIFKHYVWYDDKYEYTERNEIKSVQDGFIGIHFTAEKPKVADSFSAGFNIQFMSGNRLNTNHWGLYGGFDFGMQFFGKGKTSGVILNNTNQDSGFTKLRSSALDFLGRMHLEYAKYPVIPYFNIAAGPRLYNTSQVVGSYTPLQNTESNTTSNSVHTSVSMMYGFGAGLRFRISPVVSFDVRYERFAGTPVKKVNMNESQFNGLQYDLKIEKVKPQNEQIKFGLLFDISETEYDKKLIEKGHYQLMSYDTVVTDKSDTGKVFIPCNCLPCNSSSINKATTPNDNGGNNNRKNSEPINIPSGRQKSSFPEIKPPSKPVIHN